MLKYFDMLKKAGAVKAAQIDASTIVTAPWTIYKCRYGCDFQEIIDCYHYGILFNLNEDSFTGVTPLAVEVAREAFLDGYYKAIAFGSGPCCICEKCALETCRFPKKTVPSMEGCGIDVFKTARNNGFKIEPLKEREEEHNYFGLILLE